MQKIKYPTNMIWKKDKDSWVVNRFMGVDWSDVDWEHVGKQACPHCQARGDDNSGNNLHTYGYDDAGLPLGGKCYREELVIVSVEKAIEDANEEAGNKAKDYVKKYDGGNKAVSDFDLKKESKELRKLKEERLSQEELDRIIEDTGSDPKNKRGMDKEISEKYGIRYQYYEKSGKVKVMMIPAHIEEDGVFQITGYKVRNFDKAKEDRGHFYSIGYVGKLNCFMGQQLKRGENHVLIVGGEIDAVSADTMIRKHSDLKKFHKNYLVVSSLIGEPATFEVCKRNYEFITSFSQVVLGLDNDKAGKEATESIKGVLPNETLFTTKMTHKDANEYWEE